MEFLEFLLAAKRRTYAGETPATAAADPLVPGAVELAWGQGQWHYRDLYFGAARFSGTEWVTRQGVPFWAMSYAGGVLEAPPKDEVSAIYRFLRAALRQVPAELPFRGPLNYSLGDFRYENAPEGDLDSFEGREQIFRAGKPCYRLTYAGGLIL